MLVCNEKPGFKFRSRIVQIMFVIKYASTQVCDAIDAPCHNASYVHALLLPSTAIPSNLLTCRFVQCGVAAHLNNMRIN